MKAHGPPRRQTSDTLVSDVDALRPLVLQEFRRGQGLFRQAEACAAGTFRAQARSRPRELYSRLEGMVVTAQSVVYVRRDGSVVGDRAVRERMRRPATPCPTPGTASPPPPPRGAGAVADPLATTIHAARCFDRMLSVEFLVAGDRPLLDAVRATASLKRPGDGADAAGSTLTADVTDVGGAHIVHLRGELDMATADSLRATLLGLAGSTLTVDLSELRFIDAAGLSALMVSRRDTTAAGHRFSITGASAMVRKVFELTDLAYFLDDCSSPGGPRTGSQRDGR